MHPPPLPRFPEQPEDLAEGGHEVVTITRKEYDLLLLRERAISVLAEGMTIADCSQPDMPLM